MSVTRFQSMAKCVFVDYNSLFANRQHWCKMIEQTHRSELKELYNRIHNSAEIGMTRFYFDLNHKSELVLPKTDTPVHRDVLRYMTEKGFIYDSTTYHVPVLSWEPKTPPRLQ